MEQANRSPILDRARSLMLSESTREEATELLRAAIDRVSITFPLLETAAPDAQGVDRSLLDVLLHLIEMVDAVEVQQNQCCLEPARLALRSAFQGVLAIGFLVESGGDYRQRALAWQVGQIRGHLRLYEKLDRRKPAGQAFEKALQGDVLRPDFPWPSAKQSVVLDSLASNFTAILQNPLLVAINAEYDRREKGGRVVSWYSLFNGPRNLRQLAQRLKMASYYEFLYGHWSEVAHAQDRARFVQGGDGPSGPDLRQPNLDRIRFQTTMAIHLLRHGSLIAAGHINVPIAANLEAWFIADFGTRHRALLGQELDDVKS